jgi:hypothetical protein
MNTKKKIMIGIAVCFCAYSAGYIYYYNSKHKVEHSSVRIHSSKAGEQEFCQKIATIAKRIMTQRQHGVPITQVLDEYSSDSVRSLVVQTYRYPMFHVESNKEEAAEEYYTKNFIICLEVMNGE